MSTMKKLSLLVSSIVFFTFFSLLLSAQDSMSKQDNTGKQMMSATGCLKKGSSPDGYYLKGDDGKTYELWGYKNLGEHVNHKVTVTGMEQKMSDTMEKEKQGSETTEAGGQPQVDLKVHHLKMISDSCQ